MHLVTAKSDYKMGGLNRMNILEQIDNLANTSNKDSWSDMVTGKAILNPEQEATFLRGLQIADPVMQLSTLKLMNKPSRQGSRFSISRGALQWGYSSGHTTKTNLTEATKNFTPIEVTTTKMKAYTSYTDDEMEENIEQSSFQQTLLDEMAYIIGQDNTEWHYFGDTSIAAAKDPNACLKAGDGWVKRTASANKIVSKGIDSSAGAFDITDGVEVMFDAMRAKLPIEARQKVATNGIFLCPFEIEDAYRNSMIGRYTPLGDSKLEGYDGLKYKNIPVVYSPGLDSEIGQGIDDTATCILTTPDNLEQNVFKQMTVEFDRQAKEEETDVIFRYKAMPSLVNENYIVTAKIDADEKGDIQSSNWNKPVVTVQAAGGD